MKFLLLILHFFLIFLLCKKGVLNEKRCKKRLPHVVKSENEFFIRHQAPFNEVLKTDYDKLILGKEYGVLYEPSEDKHIDKIDKKENQGFLLVNIWVPKKNLIKVL